MLSRTMLTIHYLVAFFVHMSMPFTPISDNSDYFQLPNSLCSDEWWTTRSSMHSSTTIYSSWFTIMLDKWKNIALKCRKIRSTGNRWNRVLFASQKKQKFGFLSNCRYCVDSVPNLPGPAPNIWLTMFQISSKSVHFRRSYSRTGQHRSFAP